MGYFDHFPGFGTPKAAPGNPSTKPIRENRPLKTKLQEASKHIPRYLFRMWHPRSGGDPSLNSTTRIVPHAFRKDINLRRTVYDMTIGEFVENTTSHLRSHKHVLSEFSSWSASPRFAFHYATMGALSPYIAIIDTDGLQNDGKNVMFHVPALQKVFGTAASMRGTTYDTYDWEYLVHGVIEGKHYKAVSFHTLCDHGLIEQFPAFGGYVNAWRTDKHPLPPLMVSYTKKEVQELNKIAKLFGPNFCAAFTIALFCCKKRISFGAELKANELSEIVDVLGGRSNVPLDWNGSRGVVCDGIYDPRYEDNKQMVIVMRALSAHCWGKGARNRLMSEGNILVSDAVMDVLTEKMNSASVDCDTSEEQNYSRSTSCSLASYDSGYGSQEYDGGDNRRAHHPPKERTVKSSCKPKTDEASSVDEMSFLDDYPPNPTAGMDPHSSHGVKRAISLKKQRR